MILINRFMDDFYSIYPIQIVQQKRVIIQYGLWMKSDPIPSDEIPPKHLIPDTEKIIIKGLGRFQLG